MASYRRHQLAVPGRVGGPLLRAADEQNAEPTYLEQPGVPERPIGLAQPRELADQKPSCCHWPILGPGRGSAVTRTVQFGRLAKRLVQPLAPARRLPKLKGFCLFSVGKSPRSPWEHA